MYYVLRINKVLDQLSIGTMHFLETLHVHVPTNFYNACMNEELTMHQHNYLHTFYCIYMVVCIQKATAYCLLLTFLHIAPISKIPD